jgi:MFS family permease
MNEISSTPNYWLIMAGLLLALIAIAVYGWISWKFVKRSDGRQRRSLIGGLVLGSGFAACGLSGIIAWSALDFWPLVVVMGLFMAVLGVTSLWTPVGLVKFLARNAKDKES